MRRRFLPSVAILILLSLFGTLNVFGDEQTVNLVSKVLESFDAADQTSEWFVKASKFKNEDPLYQIGSGWPDNLWGSNSDNLDLRVLGLQAEFQRPGYNYLEIYPTADGGETINYLPFEGRIQSIDVWVWGASYDYYMELYLRDYEGVVHKLDLGTINHIGWKNIQVNIPSSIPQADREVLKTLEFEKFMIWTRPTERVKGFLFYIDHIKYLTDSFITRFDGDDLDPDGEKYEAFWGAANE